MFFATKIPAKFRSGFLLPLREVAAKQPDRKFNFLRKNNFHQTNSSMDISGMRISYDEEPFKEDNLISKEPIAQFKDWFDTACRTSGIAEANAVCLATANRNGRPSARMVLLKGFSKDGFKFYTNYDSRKGKELAENPFAALTFYWEPLRRQIRIEGTIQKLSVQDSVAYFNSRPRDSQLGAKASNQSEVLSGKQELIDKFSALRTQYQDSSVPIPKPENWGGFQLVPEVVEFWQGQTNRLHDRIRFRRPGELEATDEKTVFAGTDGWVYERLSP